MKILMYLEYVVMLEIIYISSDFVMILSTVQRFFYTIYYIEEMQFLKILIIILFIEKLKLNKTVNKNKLRIVFSSSSNIGQEKYFPDRSKRHNANCHENSEDHFLFVQNFSWTLLRSPIYNSHGSKNFTGVSPKLKTILTFQNIISWVHLFYWCSMYEFIPRVLLNLISKLHDHSFTCFWKLIFLGSYFKYFS